MLIGTESETCAFGVAGGSWRPQPRPGPLAVYVAVGLVGLQPPSVEPQCPFPYTVTVWVNGSYLDTVPAVEWPPVPRRRGGRGPAGGVRAAARGDAGRARGPAAGDAGAQRHQRLGRPTAVGPPGHAITGALCRGRPSAGRRGASSRWRTPAGEWNPRSLPLVWEVACTTSRFDAVTAPVLYHPRAPESPLYGGLDVEVRMALDPTITSYQVHGTGCRGMAQFVETTHQSPFPTAPLPLPPSHTKA